MENNTTPKRCQLCGRAISERQIAIYKGMVYALWRIFLWAKQNGVYEFTRKDIKPLLKSGKTENNTARWGDWPLFGGLVYKSKKAHYGLNMERCEEFFSGRLAIPTSIWKNPVTGELRKERLKTIHELPSIMALLNEEGEYQHLYR